jgi:hypothetical protein
MHDSTTTQPALARTDSSRRSTSATPTATPTATTTDHAATISRTAVRRLGLALTGGATAWAASIFVYGTNDKGFGGRVGDLTGLLFQLGVFALLTVMFHTRATGTSRAARIMIRVEYVLLGLASVWSLIHALAPDAIRESGPVLVLDVFWPLSMLGMFVIGIKVAFAGRWQGVLRAWPLVAETWAVVTVPTFLIVGEPVSSWVGGAHLLVGYATLGLLLARRPELAGAAD